ncbi:MAG: MerR family transcriptional regulator [Deltaproteobacteria bacterium]|nr:MerR family transcriptional regulator [Deltaproteobacteria bacterium]
MNREITVNYYGISEAARLCNVKPRQLLYWEKKGYIPAPDRIELGEVAHRQYSQRNLVLLRAMKKFLDEGFTLPVAARKMADYLSNQKGGKENGCHQN